MEREVGSAAGGGTTGLADYGSVKRTLDDRRITRKMFSY